MLPAASGREDATDEASALPNGALATAPRHGAPARRPGTPERGGSVAR